MSSSLSEKIMCSKYKVTKVRNTNLANFTAYFEDVYKFLDDLFVNVRNK